MEISKYSKYQEVLERNLDRCTEAIQQDPTNAQVYYDRGYWYEDTDPQPAVEDFDKAIEIDPAFADAYCNRGSA